MMNPFRRRSATEAKARIVGADASGSSSSFEIVTPIPSSDRKVPQDFVMPSLAETMNEMYLRIDAVAERGGLDAGNAAFADQWTDDQLAAWLQKARVEGKEHEHVAAQIMGQVLQNLTTAYHHLLLLEKQAHALRTREKGFLTELLSLDPSEHDISAENVSGIEPSQEEMQEILHALPQASQLDGFGLQPAHGSVRGTRTSTPETNNNISPIRPANTRSSSEHNHANDIDNPPEPTTGSFSS